MPAEHTLIVGGTSGIGLATARRLIGAGHQVTVTGRDEAKLNSALGTLGRAAHGVRLDGQDRTALPKAFERIGAIDHLVLCIGSHKGLGPFSTLSLDEVRQGFEEKTIPHIACAQAALPQLRKDGSLTFVSAVTGQAALPMSAGIAAANAAIAALAPVLAVELKPLRVNAVSPGVVGTHFWDFLPEDQRSALFDQYGARTPVGRNGKAEDVADAIVFLMGNGYVSGHVLICDGGLRYGC